MQHFLLKSPWFAICSIALSLAWLLPNHYPPWTSFHSEAWAALVLCIVCAYVFIKNTQNLIWNRVNYFTLAVAMLPMYQYWAGTIFSFGTAWICFLYLAGLFISIRLGQVWRSNHEHEGSDMLFFAIITASAVSTIIQICQWMNLKDYGLWINQPLSLARLDANMAQPNQLGTLHLLAAVGYSRLINRKNSLVGIVTPLVCLTLLGVALTGSRTATLNMAILSIVALVVNKNRNRKYSSAIYAFAIYYIALKIMLYVYNGAIQAGDELSAASTNARLEIWKLFIKATLERPILGYGWGQIPFANLMQLPSDGLKMGLSNSAHNIIIDMMLYCGYPVTLAIVYSCYKWTKSVIVSGVSPTDWHAIGALLVLAVHAMLEFPQNYAYFLLPAGVLIGGLDRRDSTMNINVSRIKIDVLICISLLICLIGLINDYLYIERQYYVLRLQSAKVLVKEEGKARMVFGMEQYSNYINFARNKPKENVTKNEINSMRDIVFTTPSTQVMYNLAANLALNGEEEEARYWQRAICSFMAEVNCEQSKYNWRFEEYEKRTGVEWK